MTIDSKRSGTVAPISYDQERKIDVVTWNPFTGCTKISPGCKHCYAETMAHKLQKWGTAGYENGFTFTVQHDRIDKAEPLKRRKPTLYFINSMSDTFHEDADDHSVGRVMEIVERAHWHNFYILTKRSDRMRAWFDQWRAPDNLWMGVTVDDREYGLPRLEDLREANVKNKHICCEPLLEDLGELDLSGIRLVVGGGESGPKARRAQPEWVESLRDQCLAQNVHLYWKQWGSYGPDGVYRGRGRSGHLINGKSYLSFPDDLMP
jgi:protein gp37